MRNAALSLLLALAAGPAAAQVRASGYFRNIWQYSRSAFDARPYNLNTSRARLTLDAEKSVFRAHADYDHQVAAGSYFRTREFQAFGYAPPAPWLDMQGTLSTGTTNGYGHGVYRGWIGLEGERGVLRAGRQRIAWGTGKIWNPTDVLNPYQPTSVERDQRRGVDALYARAGVGPLGQAELVWAGGDRWVDHQVLARGRATAGSWDASLLAGKVAGSTASFMAGGDAAGTLLDGTLHAEWAAFRPQWRAPYWKGNVGYDYSWPSDTRVPGLKDASLVLEYLHSGRGESDVRRYDFAPLREGSEVTVARHYFGGVATKDLHPLLKLELYALANADDASTFFSPALTWNALTDLHLTAALQRFGGERATEFGRNPNQTVLTVQYYF